MVTGPNRAGPPCSAVAEVAVVPEPELEEEEEEER